MSGVIQSSIRSAKAIWRRLPVAVRVALPLFLAVRIGLSLFAVTSLQVFPAVEVPAEYWRGIEPVTEGVHGWLLGPWQRWDTLWYLRIASLGYDPTDGSTAFFPLYSLVIRLLARPLKDDYLLAAMLISNLACLGAAILLYKITNLEFDHGSARRAVVYQLLFPTAFFLFAPYTESLFLLWATASLYSARRGKWWWAGSFGFLAGLTRLTGAALALPLLYEMWRRNDRRLDRFPLRWASIGLPFLGLAVYSLYLYARFGNPLLWLNIQGQGIWTRSFAWPWDTAYQIVASLFQPPNNAIDLLLTLLFIFLTILAFKKLRATYGLYMLLSMLPPLLRPRAGAPLCSMPRFVLVLFPSFMVLGQIGKKPLWHRLILYNSLLFLTFFTALFVAWYWVA